ncbi:MAG TPA: hypothetical protein VGS20_11290 [Candidatus Acidoferrales bacterium]|nr:hypothetical protein [Candidatus Acidoferrales bacterium]
MRACDLEFALATVAALLASYHLFVHELTPLLVAAFPILGYEGPGGVKGWQAIAGQPRCCS